MNLRVNLSRYVYLMLCAAFFFNPVFEAPKNIFFGLALILFVFSLLNERISLSLFDWFILFFAPALLLASMWSTFPVKASAFVDVFRYMMVFFIISKIRLNNSQKLNLIVVAGLGTVVAIFYGAYIHFHLGIGDYWELPSVGHVNHSAIYAVIMASMISSVLILNWGGVKIRNKVLLITTLFIISYYIFVGESRSAFAIYCIVVLLQVLFLFSSNKKAAIFGLSFFAFILTVLVFSDVRVVQKQESLIKSNNILSYRSEIWNVAMHSNDVNFIFGVGKNNFNKIDMTLVGINDANGERVKAISHAHNIYVNTFAETGIIGFSMYAIYFLCLFYLLLIYFRQVFLKNGEADRAYWLGAFSTLLVTLGIGLVNTTFHHEHALISVLAFSLFINKARED
ncbi:O-antigen ligase family protein [Plesiomonas shigelloides]|uniref:O-antigen ligase family protein n=1 Tax=Plesiomonas shigelloides TaxID=703 RepID=UPI000A0F4187|nr:O-antigen ligase family protein [Plesiomonas shigelloides]